MNHGVLKHGDQHANWPPYSCSLKLNPLSPLNATRFSLTFTTSFLRNIDRVHAYCWERHACLLLGNTFTGSDMLVERKCGSWRKHCKSRHLMRLGLVQCIRARGGEGHALNQRLACWAGIHGAVCHVPYFHLGIAPAALCLVVNVPAKPLFLGTWDTTATQSPTRTGVCTLKSDHP